MCVYIVINDRLASSNTRERLKLDSTIASLHRMSNAVVKSSTSAWTLETRACPAVRSCPRHKIYKLIISVKLFSLQPEILVKPAFCTQILYALPAWGGFLTADLIGKIDDYLCKAIRWGYTGNLKLLSELDCSAVQSDGLEVKVNNKVTVNLVVVLRLYVFCATAILYVSATWVDISFTRLWRHYVFYASYCVECWLALLDIRHPLFSVILSMYVCPQIFAAAIGLT